MSKANMIHLHAAPNAADALARFLEQGGKLVDSTEPTTQRWYALRRQDDPEQLAIFDVFADQAGRQAHFDGQVAAALSEKAEKLVVAGWPGVLEHVSNFVSIATHEADLDADVQYATAITMHAAPNQREALANFLNAGCQLVAKTEPSTVYWTALASEDESNKFVIFDLFTDEAGRTKHFGGQVAALLKEKASTLVEGGWENGVLANVAHYEVRAVVRRGPSGQ